MTTGLILGSHYKFPEICENVIKLGFKMDSREGKLMHHVSVPNLDLQIKMPAYFRDIDFHGIGKILTEIEFEDKTDLFPENERAIKILVSLNQTVPYLYCRQPYIQNNPSKIEKLDIYLNQLKCTV